MLRKCWSININLQVDRGTSNAIILSYCVIWLNSKTSLAHAWDCCHCSCHMDHFRLIWRHSFMKNQDDALMSLCLYVTAKFILPLMHVTHNRYSLSKHTRYWNIIPYYITLDILAIDYSYKYFMSRNSRWSLQILIPHHYPKQTVYL